MTVANLISLKKGKFKKINREEEEEPFTLGDFEPPNTINKNEIPNELIPEIRDSVENVTNNLFETLVLWFDDHLERISSRLNKEILS